MDAPNQLFEKIQAVATIVRAHGAKMVDIRIKVSKIPQRGTSKSTAWDRHRPNHFRNAVRARR